VPRTIAANEIGSVNKAAISQRVVNELKIELMYRDDDNSPGPYPHTFLAIIRCTSPTIVVTNPMDTTTSRKLIWVPALIDLVKIAAAPIVIYAAAAIKYITMGYSQKVSHLLSGCSF
jgi:hypothetical protein